MIVRLWNPDRDAPGALAELWNDYYGTALWNVSHFQRLEPSNTIVADDAGTLVASTFLHDGGGPYAVVDEIVARPRYKRFAVSRDILLFVDALCRDRGLLWFNGVLGMNGAEGEQFASLLSRRAHFPVQYLGERPMYCRSLT